MQSRRPRRYIGRNHETIGSDILSAVRALTFPGAILGTERVEQLEKLSPDGWYPIDVMLELMDTLEQRIGHAGLMKMGRTLFKMSHEAHVVASVRSARELLQGFDGIYRRANRGTAIGGWTVLKFEPGRAELEKTTPHHCAMEEGLLDAALTAIGVPSRVTQSTCFRKGADACIFVITSDITDARWNGAG